MGRYVSKIHIEMNEPTSDKLIPQAADDIARRTLALIAVVDRAHNENAEQLANWVTKHSIDSDPCADRDPRIDLD